MGVYYITLQSTYTRQQWGDCYCKCIDEDERFWNIIGTDGCSVSWIPIKNQVHEGQECQSHLNLAPNIHKIYIWGGISMKGSTPLVMFSGIMNATKYALRKWSCTIYKEELSTGSSSTARQWPQIHQQINPDVLYTQE